LTSFSDVAYNPTSVTRSDCMRCRFGTRQAISEDD
jgi:hypothetical protein